MCETHVIPSLRPPPGFWNDNPVVSNESLAPHRPSLSCSTFEFLLGLILIPPSCPLLVFPSAESDFTHDAFCMSECRKEKDEKEYYCYSEFGMYPMRDTSLLYWCESGNRFPFQLPVWKGISVFPVQMLIIRSCNPRVMKVSTVCFPMSLKQLWTG